MFDCKSLETALISEEKLRSSGLELLESEHVGIFDYMVHYVCVIKLYWKSNLYLLTDK